MQLRGLDRGSESWKLQSHDLGLPVSVLLRCSASSLPKWRYSLLISHRERTHRLGN